MKQFVLAVIAATLLCGSAMGAPVQRAVYEIDQQRYLTVVGELGDPEFRAIKKQLATARQVSTVMFAERHQDEYPELPAVKLQTATGDVLYEAAGDELTSVSLSEQLAELNCHRREDRRDRRDTRRDGGEAPPFESTSESEAPEVSAPPRPRFPWIMAALAVISGSSTAVGMQVSKEWA